ncbi:uncharacterized protein LOC100181781 [Ciona intestinalis]
MIGRAHKCRILKSFLRFLFMMTFCLYVTLKFNGNGCKSSLKHHQRDINDVKIVPLTGRTARENTVEANNLELLTQQANLTRTQHMTTTSTTIRTTTTSTRKTTTTVAKTEIPTKELIKQVENDEWLSCMDITDVLTRAKQDKSSVFREENSDGNRAVYFATIYDNERKRIHVVIKFANREDLNSASGLYRYRTALREVDNLRLLRSLYWKGVPRLLGACVTNSSVTYVVTRVMQGSPICPGRGLNASCFFGEPFRSVLERKSNPGLAGLTWVAKVTCFFAQFERDRIFMEDVSGSNLYFDNDSLDIHLVDADSLIVYGESPLYSRTLCRHNNDCPSPRGNLWGPDSLNQKLYSSCLELFGYCVNSTCRGLDASLHTCGVGKWLVATVRYIIPTSQYNDYRNIMHCMMETYPDKRCTMTSSCERATKLLKSYDDVT